MGPLSGPLQISAPPAPAVATQATALGSPEQELAARIAYVHDQIAEKCYLPTQPPRPWNGRDDVLKLVADTFGVDHHEAAGVVDLAVADLYDRQHLAPTQVLKAGQLRRLFNLRQLLVRAVKNSTSEDTCRREPTYDYLCHPDDVEKPLAQRRLVEQKVKEKRYPGLDLAAVGKLLEVEMQIARLQGLEGREEGQNTRLYDAIFGALDEAADRDTKARVAASLAHKVRNGSLADLNPAGQERIAAALEDLSGRRAVDSVPVPAPPAEAIGPKPRPVPSRRAKRAASPTPPRSDTGDR